MAKFCTKCGKELKDGKACDCEVVSSNEGVDVSGYVNSYIDIIKGIFTKPITTIKKYVTADNFTLGIITLIVNCIITGLFTYCLLNEGMKSFGMISRYVGLGLTSIDVPFMRVFLYGFVFMAVWFIAMALMIYLIANVIMKDKIDIKEVFTLVGVTSVFTAVTTFVALICIYISVKLMALIITLASVFYLTYLVQGISELTSINKNKLAYVFVPALTVTMFVVCYILPKILF